MAETAETAPDESPLDIIGSPCSAPQAWKRLARQTHLENPWFRVHLDDVELPSGKRLLHWVIDYKKPGAGVAPVLEDGRVLLGLHYRYCPEKWSWEIVSGGVEPGEEPRDAALRELAEETGYNAAQLDFLGEYHPAPGIGNERFILFAARGLSPSNEPLDRDEIQRLRPFGWRDVEQAIERREIVDGFTLTGLLWCRARGILAD